MCDYTELECRELTIRKPKQCPWCAEDIRPGERAQLRVYLWDGEFVRRYMHPECFTAMGKADYDGCDHFFIGDYPRGCSIRWNEGGQRPETLPPPTDDRIKLIAENAKVNAWKYQ